MGIEYGRAVAGMRDFFDAFRGATPGGETAAGTWRYLERYGRVSGMGEVQLDLELPKGAAVISVEEIMEVSGFEVELTGPGGEAVALKRFPDTTDFEEAAMHNLVRVAEAHVTLAGVHHLRVVGTDRAQELVVVVGAEPSAKDALFGRL